MHQPQQNPLSPPCNPALSAPSPEGPLRVCLRKALGHELPNHLVALQGLIRVLEWEEADRLSDEGRGYLHRLAAAAERVHGMIHTLADLVRPESADHTAAPVPFLEVAREAGAEVEPLLVDCSVTYHSEAEGVLLAVPRLGLRQVLVQLLRNAVQASRRAEEPVVELGAQEDRHGASFWVADYGQGFAPELLPQLDDFLAGQVATLGNGFGLLFVRLVAESWGGRLQIQSEPGRGCTVAVILPP